MLVAHRRRRGQRLAPSTYLADAETSELLRGAGDDKAQVGVVVVDLPVDERAAGALGRDQIAQPPR